MTITTSVLRLISNMGGPARIHLLQGAIRHVIRTEYNGQCVKKNGRSEPTYEASSVFCIINDNFSLHQQLLQQEVFVPHKFVKLYPTDEMLNRHAVLQDICFT